MSRGILSLLLLLSSLTSLAQSSGRGRLRQDLSFYYDYGQLIYVEAVNLAANDRTKSRVLVNFRVAYDAVTFQKPTALTHPSDPFMGVVTVRAELLDERDVTTQRASWHDTIQVKTFAETNDKARFIFGSAALEAPPGKYTVVVTIEDGTSRQVLREIRPRLELRDFRKSPQISQCLVLSRTDSLIANPMNLGGSAEFGTPCIIHTDVISDSVVPTVRYALLRMSKNGDSTVVATGNAIVTAGNRLEIHNGSCCNIEPSSTLGQYASRLLIKGDSLDIGDYLLHLNVFAGRDTCSITTPLRVVWSTMPLSLADIDYAIDAMRYILTDGALDSMKSGNAAERKKHFDEYWSALDPSPGTVYNERKTEYFRRVDYSYFTFRNPSKDDDDGMRSDRGKIYILFGSPTVVDRVLLPDGPAKETWTYMNNVKKRFEFIDNDKNGVYRLTQVTDLK